MNFDPLGEQPLAPALTAPGKNRTPTPGLHAGTKSKLPLPRPLRRLVGAFHRESSWVGFERKRRKVSGPPEDVNPPSTLNKPGLGLIFCPQPVPLSRQGANPSPNPSCPARSARRRGSPHRVQAPAPEPLAPGAKGFPAQIASPDNPQPPRRDARPRETKRRPDPARRLLRLFHRRPQRKTLAHRIRQGPPALPDLRPLPVS